MLDEIQERMAVIEKSADELKHLRGEVHVSDDSFSSPEEDSLYTSEDLSD